ncbi:MAG: 16S rRNA (adenine(1518)-N(6)/adenine(1519)-N(6))-dimethyltransferase RsmA [Gammaproteobacteria bacterium]|nr:16S rRNA (adenine(1518)-N(6)/adenine(1519)-N(6))-dimethyltransferase RsmA [Gammaproteobacteria bacterium]
MAPSHRARKRFGQHFLRDRSIIARIVAEFDPKPQDCIVEIGPGKGALTEVLLEHTTGMHVIEIDRDLAAYLQETFRQRLDVHQADALKFDFCRLGDSRKPLRLIGNLPYNISTPLLFHLLDASCCIQDMLFMLQKEVVDRLVAEPGGSDYGRLSVMVQWRCRVERLFGVAAGAFSPPPQVESAVVRLTPYQHSPVPIDDPGRFRQIVHAAFAQRRKVLRNSIGRLVEPDLMLQVGIDPTRRAETLSLAEFATLANLPFRAGYIEIDGGPPATSGGGCS